MDQQFGATPDPPRATVVVVDDDQATRESLRDLLESAGFCALLFASGEGVPARLTSLPNSCLLLDIGLPEQSGLALFAELRVLHVSSPVIFMTGRMDFAEQARRLAEPAFAVLEKPLDDRLLLQTIGNALAIKVPLAHAPRAWRPTPVNRHT